MGGLSTTKEGQAKGNSAVKTGRDRYSEGSMNARKRHRARRAIRKGGGMVTKS